MADIFGVRVTPELDTINTILIDNGPGGQTSPAVDFNGENFFVTWSQPTVNGIVVARVTCDGTILDAGNFICVGSDADIVCSSSRSFVVCSRELFGVCGRFVDDNAQPLDTVLIISTLQATSTFPKVACDTSVYLVVWSDFCPAGTDLDVYGQLVSNDGYLLGSRIPIACGPPIQSYPAVVFNGDGFFVVWSEGQQIYGQLIDRSGHLQGASFQVSDNSPFIKEKPVVCAGSENCLVAWAQWHDDYDIYGNLDNAIGVDECVDDPVYRSLPAVFSGVLPASAESCLNIYDITGRSVDGLRLKPGIYFIETTQRIFQKVIKIR